MIRAFNTTNKIVYGWMSISNTKSTNDRGKVEPRVVIKGERGDLGSSHPKDFIKFLNGIICRIEIHVGTAKEAALYLTAVPMGLGDLTYKTEVWEVELGSDRIPCIILPIGQSPNQKKGSKVAQIMIQETMDHKTGLCIFPLLEQVRDKITTIFCHHNSPFFWGSSNDYSELPHRESTPHHSREG